MSAITPAQTPITEITVTTETTFSLRLGSQIAGGHEPSRMPPRTFNFPAEAAKFFRHADFAFGPQKRGRG